MDFGSLRRCLAEGRAREEEEEKRKIVSLEVHTARKEKKLRDD